MNHLGKPSQRIADYFAPVLAWLDRYEGPVQIPTAVNFGPGDEETRAHEVGRVGFDMCFFSRSEDGLEDGFGNECGTVCCIAGLLAHLHPDVAAKVPRDTYSTYAIQAVTDMIGMPRDTASNLFFIDGFPADTAVPGFDEVTPDMAARTIRHYLETGEVVWCFQDGDK